MSKRGHWIPVEQDDIRAGDRIRATGVADVSFRAQGRIFFEKVDTYERWEPKVPKVERGLSGRALEQYTKDREFELLQALAKRLREERELEIVRDGRVLTGILADFGYVE